MWGNRITARCFLDWYYITWQVETAFDQYIYICLLDDHIVIRYNVQKNLFLAWRFDAVFPHLCFIFILLYTVLYKTKLLFFTRQSFFIALGFQYALVIASLIDTIGVVSNNAATPWSGHHLSPLGALLPVPPYVPTSVVAGCLMSIFLLLIPSN
jgi:hypothetical protein